MKRLKHEYPYVVVAGGVIELVNRDAPIRLRLADLDEVSILTTDEGPLNDDVFWVLRAGREKLVVPWWVEGAERVLPLLQTLDGFDNEAVIEASSSVEPAVFSAWRRAVRVH
jgi:hypothetical protein